MSGRRFKGLGSISSEAVPSPPAQPAPPAPPASPAAAVVPPLVPAVDTRFIVPDLEPYSVPLRRYHGRIKAYHDSLPGVRCCDKPFSSAAVFFGLQKEWAAIKPLQDRVDALARGAAPLADFGKAIETLETSFRAFLTSMEAALVGNVQGSLL